MKLIVISLLITTLSITFILVSSHLTETSHTIFGDSDASSDFPGTQDLVRAAQSKKTCSKKCQKGETCVKTCKPKCSKGPAREENCLAKDATCNSTKPNSGNNTCCAPAGVDKVSGDCLTKTNKCIECVSANAFGPCKTYPCCELKGSTEFDSYCGDFFGRAKCNQCKKLNLPCHDAKPCCKSADNPDKGGCAADRNCSDTVIPEGSPCDPTKDVCETAFEPRYQGFCNNTSKSCIVCVANGGTCANAYDATSKIEPCCPVRGSPTKGGCGSAGTCIDTCLKKNQPCAGSGGQDECCQPADGNEIGVCSEKKCINCVPPGKSCRVTVLYPRTDPYYCCADSDTTGGCDLNRKCSISCIKEGLTCNPTNRTDDYCCSKIKSSYTKGYCNASSKCDSCIKDGQKCLPKKYKCCSLSDSQGGCDSNYKCSSRCIKSGGCDHTNRDDNQCCSSETVSFTKGYCTKEDKCDNCIKTGEICTLSDSECCGQDLERGGCDAGGRCTDQCIKPGNPCDIYAKESQCCYPRASAFNENLLPVCALSGGKDFCGPPVCGFCVKPGHTCPSKDSVCCGDEKIKTFPCLPTANPEEFYCPSTNTCAR